MGLLQMLKMYVVRLPVFKLVPEANASWTSFVYEEPSLPALNHMLETAVTRVSSFYAA